MLSLESLNASQRRAVTHEAGPLLVLAGPGSGKTFTVIQRICYLLERKRVPPERILVITFTRAAALEMQSRFAATVAATSRGATSRRATSCGATSCGMLSPEPPSCKAFPVNFGTFHSVFYHILIQSHVLKTTQILTPSRKKKLLLGLTRQWSTGGGASCDVNDGQEEIPRLLEAIGFYKNTGDFRAALEKLSGEWRPRFGTLFEAYERERRRTGGMDFDDMIYECRRLLREDAEWRAYWQGRFDHILIDEFQDISPVQYETVRLLAGDSCGLFAVGDDDQSIYGFRGAQPSCLRRFVQDYGAEQVCLNINYRSRAEIVRASLAVIGENRDRFAKELRPSPERKDTPAQSGCGVALRAFAEREEQYRYLTERLRECGNRPGKSVGVLFRTNTHMQGLAVRLNREGIPYAMKERAANIYEHFVARDIMAYLKLAAGLGNRADFLRIMNRPSRYISREAVGEGEPDFGKILRYYREEGKQAPRAVEKWSRQMKSLGGLSPCAAVQYVRRAIGYEAYLREKAGEDRERWQEWEELLDWLGADAAAYATPELWMRAQEDYARKLESGRAGGRGQGRGGNPPQIELMTVHASKGLEFDTVYVPDCNEKVFPHGKMPDNTVCEEERRLFYVAMTRAKESLELLYLTGTGERPRLPSRFLNPLFSLQSSSISSSNSQLSRYSSKASATFSYSSSSSI